MSKLDPERLKFGLYLIALIILAELVLHHFHLPGWPAFMVMIFFFSEHMDIKKVPAILVGGCVGLACILGAGVAVKLGGFPALLAFIAIVVYAIVAFGEIVPVVFNNYLFMYFTVGGVAAKAADPNPFLWMAIELLGGATFIGGIIVIGKLMAPRDAEAATAAASAEQ